MNHTSFGAVGLPPESRLEVVDALRGIALGGILVVNMLLFKASPSFDHLAATNIGGDADRLAAVAIKILAEGKFIALFSLLFGFGVATQVARWQTSGLRWRALYVRRMAGLAVIGAVHLILIWFGDILTTYAVLSVVVFAFLNRSPRTQLRWALGILGALATVAVVSLGLLGIRDVTGSTTLVAQERSTAAADRIEVARLDAIYRSADYLELVQERLSKPGGMIFGLTFGLVVLAMMLLGMYIARSGLLTNRTALTAVARAGIGIGLPLNVLVVVVQSGGGLFTVLAAQLLLMALAAPLLALGFAAVVVLLHERHRMPMLAATGRLALTNYLLQSVVLTTVFYAYGLGYYGRIGVAAALCLAAALYGGQMIASRWWSRRFGAGPVERIWRWTTYRSVRTNVRAARPR